MDTMSLLRDKVFQDLLMNYPRKERRFIVAYETQDTVTSSWLVRGIDGKEYKPDDYLTAFAQFVRENPQQIEAIRILLQRPKDWSTKALSDLQQKLAATPQRFNKENLQRAHELHYQKALVDIISMVKHAANEQQPLYTAEERVKLAMAKITSGKNFTPEQVQWLERIEGHLTENLTIDPERFRRLASLQSGGRLGSRQQGFRRTASATDQPIQ